MEAMPIYPRETYRAHPSRTVDGDTIDILKEPVRLRLLGFDAAELRGGTEEEKALAREQANWVDRWLAASGDIITDERGKDVFGRGLAWVFDRETGACLNHMFVIRYPAHAVNPRYQVAGITGEDPRVLDSFRPRPRPKDTRPEKPKRKSERRA